MRRLIVITGAGFSAESGIRTFRTDTPSGKPMWDEYKLEEVCSIHAFDAGFRHRFDPMPPLHSISEETEDRPSVNLYELTHQFYNKRRVEMQTVEPNLAHLRVAEWYKRFPGQVINLTTNVDDLLERAGVDRKDIIHVHGYLPEMRVKREKNGPEEMIDVGYSQVDIDQYAWCKPNVVFFHENAPLYQDMYDLFDSITNQDMFLIVGCSNTVIDFRYLLTTPILYQGAKLGVINLYDPAAAQNAKYPSTVYSRSDMSKMDEMGIPHWDNGAVDAFSSESLITMVENHLEGKTCLQSK